MKKLLLACCVAAVASSPALANKDMDPSEKADYLDKVLQLNDQQAQQVEQILEQASKQKDDLKSKYTIAQYDEYRDQKKQMHSKLDDQISGVLNADQKAAYEALMEHKKQKKGAMHKMMEKMKD